MTKKPKLNAPVVAKSGDETKRQQWEVNNNRTLDFKIMTEPGRSFEPRPSRGITGRYPN